MRAAIALALILLAPLALAQGPKPMTNDDVVAMSKAKLSEDLILSTVASSSPGFDTSATAVIELSKAGVSEKIIKAMIDRTSAGAAPAGGAQAAAGAEDGLNPEIVVLVEGETRTNMRYATPQMRAAARALGFGGVASYATLPGESAELRITNPQPTFVVAIPENAQPEGYLTVASFEKRKNGTREVATGGGYISYSSGINKDRVMPSTTEKLADQSRARKGYVLYSVKVTEPLKKGEYAFILYTGQIRSVGYFASGGDSYFDFGID